MKTKLFSRISAIMMAIALMFTAASCDILGNIDKDGDGVYDGYTQGWTEEGNKIVYRFDLDLYVAKWVYILEFTFGADDKCTKATQTIHFPNAETAQDYYDDLDPDTATINGKKVTEDLTEEFAGMEKAELKETIESAYGSGTL